MQEKGEKTSQNNWITSCSTGVSTLRGNAPFVPRGNFGITPSSADSLVWYTFDTLVLTTFILTGWIPVYFQMMSRMYQTMSRMYQTMSKMYQTMSKNRSQMTVMNPWFVNQKSVPWVQAINTGHRTDSEIWKVILGSSCVHGYEDSVDRVIITRCTEESMLMISTHHGSSVSSVMIMLSMTWEQVSVSANIFTSFDSISPNSRISLQILANYFS